MRLGPQGQKHWFADYPWDYQVNEGKLRRWSDQFLMASRMCHAVGIRVFNASRRSAISVFPKTAVFERKVVPAA
jgi:hypothetical protein